MADTYGVVPADVAAELPGIFPGGFSATSIPSDALVAELIAAADLAVTLAIVDFVGTAPAATDRAAPLARRYVLAIAKAETIRVAMTGRDPVIVAQMTAPYDAVAKLMLSSIELLGTQIIGIGEPSSRVLTSMGSGTMPTRDLVIDDLDLDAGSGLRGRY